MISVLVKRKEIKPGCHIFETDKCYFCEDVKTKRDKWRRRFIFWGRVFLRGIKLPAALVILRPKLYYFTDAKMITARNTDRVRKDFIIFVHP